ncbi:MAG: hypothetical protein ACSHYA_16790 [Opitutaceae bacterium]
MKLSKWILIVGIFSLLLVGQTQATVIASDSFDRDGVLAGQEGGTGFVGPWEGGNYVVSDGVVTGSGDAYRNLLLAFGDSGEIWISFNLVKNSGKGYGGISFFEDNNERLIVGDWFEQGFWSMDTKVKVAEGRQTSNVPLTKNRTAVIRITLGSGSSSLVDLWVGEGSSNPVDVSGAPLLSFSGADLAGVNRIRIGSDFNQSIENLTISDSYGEIAWIPEVSNVGLLCGLIALGCAFRRRR